MAPFQTMIKRPSFLLSCGTAIFDSRLPHYHKRGRGTEDCLCLRARLRSGTHHFWLTFPWPELGHMWGNWDWSPAACPRARGHSCGPSLARLCCNCFLSSLTLSPWLCNLSFLLLHCKAWWYSQNVESLGKHLKIHNPVKFWILKYVNFKSVI